MLLGYKIGLTSCYYMPTVEGMYKEYSNALDILIMALANRLQRKDENLTIEKSTLDRIEEKLLKMNKCIKSKTRKFSMMPRSRNCNAC